MNTKKMCSSKTSLIIFSSIVASTMAVLAPASFRARAFDPTHANSQQDFLDAHNRVRAEVGVGSLVWNDTVAQYALNYARDRYLDCEMEHSNGPYGENLAEGYERLSALDAVGMWVSERPYYDYGSNSCIGGEECLHYTQVVWNDSFSLGCTRIQCQNKWLFVICNYDPPGNILGQRPYQ